MRNSIPSNRFDGRTKEVSAKGGTMRLGNYDCIISKDKSFMIVTMTIKQLEKDTDTEYEFN